MVENERPCPAKYEAEVVPHPVSESVPPSDTSPPPVTPPRVFTVIDEF